MYLLLSLVLASVSERDTVVSATATCTAAAEVIVGRGGRGKIKGREREGKGRLRQVHVSLGYPQLLRLPLVYCVTSQCKYSALSPISSHYLATGNIYIIIIVSYS